MMDRRRFLRALGVGAAVAAVPLSLAPAAEATWVELYHNGKVVYRSGRGAGASQYAQALAKSMRLTKERVVADVLTRAFNPV